MSSTLQDLKIDNHHEKWTRKKVHLELDLLPAFEAGDFHDCTIRVGRDLLNSNSTFKVMQVIMIVGKHTKTMLPYYKKIYILYNYIQDFKCHKLILSACSPVFETMFFGHFKEAKSGPDEPIHLDKTDPLVFECAMRLYTKL